MADAKTPAKAHPSTKKVLIMDDDDSILALLRSAFEMEGFQVKVGKDGRNIAKVAAEFLPDIIISDLMMPGVGGYDVLRTLQSDPITSKVPVFMITGSHMNDSTKAMLKQESNMAGYIEKPFRPETILIKVHKMLNTMTMADQRAQNSQDTPQGFNERF